MWRRTHAEPGWQGAPTTVMEFLVSQEEDEEQFEAVRIDGNATSIVGTFTTAQAAMAAADRMAAEAHQCGELCAAWEEA
jgi:hypothetical protein